MNGNGQEPQIEPPSSSSLWGDMFGFGPLFRMMQDPALGAHAHGMMQAIIEGAQSNRRIEAKLNALLGALGHDVAEIERRAGMAGGSGRFNPPVLLAVDGANGIGGFAAASVAPDDGNRQHVANAAPSDEIVGP
jgi:hypothetical protein